jgi:SAM-dependent methyltransferase
MKFFDNQYDFYHFEVFLATQPIVNFIKKNGKYYYGSLIDIGCGNKPYEAYFKNINRYIGIDLKRNKNTENYIICDINKIPCKNESFEIAICNQVIEHVPNPKVVLNEIWRVLKNDGTLIFSAPQMGRLHGEPYDFYRFTKWGLKYLLESERFKIIELNSHGGFFRAIGSHLSFFLIENFGKCGKWKKIIQVLLILPINFIFTFLDRIKLWNLDTLGYNIIAVKSDNSHYLLEKE